jgi:hypothetical protein
MRLLLPLLALAAAAAPLAAQNAPGPFTVAESNKSYRSLQAAISAIGDGSGTILIAPGRYRQCAIQDDGEVTYSAQEPGTAVFDGVTCEGKAALVLRGRAATIGGLTFQNMRVADRNGSGIRLERGNLVVRESLFRDSEGGILSGDDPEGTILVEQSTFSGLGGCPDDCSHSLYIGGYGSLVVRRDRFERGSGGHYVKSRSARVEIVDSSFDDSAGHGTNYMIDLPNGATGTIARNSFVQGRDKENYSAMIVVAAEGVVNSSAGLQVADNDARLATGVANGTAFVADLSGDPLRIGANRLGERIARFERRN